MFKIVTPITTIFLTFFLFSSCTNSSQTPNDTIVSILNAPPLTLDPLFSTDANSQHVNQLAQISLVKVGENLTPVPYLAESFKISSNKTIEFKLKKGCKFHNGDPISAEDVVKSWKLYTNPEVKSPYRHAFSKIKNIEVIDSHNIKIITENIEPQLLTDLSILKILPTKLYNKKDFQNKPVGGGPFKIQTSDQSNVLLVQHQSGCLEKPKTEKILLKVVREDLSRFLKLQKGEIDILLNELDLRKVAKILNEKNKDLSAMVAPGISYNYMGVNFANEHLRKKKVRQALAHSLDIPQVIQYKLAGLAIPAASVLSPQNWYANNTLKPIKRDLNLARKLLDEAGYYNGSNNKPKLKLTLKTTSNALVVENARAFVAQAKEVGIEINLQSYEWGTFYGDVKARNTELYLLRWVGATDPNIFYTIFHSNELERNNRTNYKNKEMDQALDKAQENLDPEKRKSAILKAQKIAHEDLPYISLYYMKNSAAFRSNLQNVKLYPNGSWDTFLHLSKKVAKK